MSLRAPAADVLTASLRRAGSLTRDAATATVRAARDVQCRDLRLPDLSALPALPAVRVNQRSGLAIAAVSGVAVASLAAVTIARRRRATACLAPQPATDTLPDLVDYPGPDPHWDRIAVGVHADGEQADIRLTYSPHVLLVGPTGGGKSVVGRNILLHALVHADEWDIVGIDLKQVELTPYAAYDNATVATTLEETVVALAKVSVEMMNRYQSMEVAGVNHFRDLPAAPKAILVYVDEAGLLAPRGGSSDAEQTADFLRAEATLMLETMARLGRAAGIHLVIAAQRMDHALTGALRGNLDVRIAMGKHGAQASELALGNGDATHVSTVRGRGVLSVYGRGEQFQSYFAKPSWFADHLASTAKQEQSIYHPISLLRVPSGIVVATGADATRKVTAAVARLDAFAELTAVTASTPAQIKQALRRGADVIGYVGSLDDPKALDRLVWAGSVGCVAYVAAPDDDYDRLLVRLLHKADARQVGCEIVHDA